MVQQQEAIMNPLHAPLPHHYLAKLYYMPGTNKAKLINWAYFTAENDVSKTAYNALGVMPRVGYTVEIRRVTPHELGMTQIGAQA